MSSKHFEVCNRIETIFVRDLNSRNGTKIFDEAIQERALSQSSRITAGKSVFEVAWEQSNEDWGTHAGSSISIRRNFSSSGFPSSSQSPLSGDSANGQSIGSIGSTGMQAESQGLGANPSAHGSFDERIAGLDITALLGPSNHRECGTVFHRTGGVVAFELAQKDVAALSVVSRANAL
jgi:hypothetical protein